MTALDVIRLGDVFRRARKNAGITSGKRAAELLSTEDDRVTQSDISRWERGAGEPTISQLRRMADLYDADWLLDVRELPSPWMDVSAGQAA